MSQISNIAGMLEERSRDASAGDKNNVANRLTAVEVEVKNLKDEIHRVEATAREDSQRAQVSAIQANIAAERAQVAFEFMKTK